MTAEEEGVRNDTVEEMLRLIKRAGSTRNQGNGGHGNGGDQQRDGALGTTSRLQPRFRKVCHLLRCFVMLSLSSEHNGNPTKGHHPSYN